MHCANHEIENHSSIPKSSTHEPDESDSEESSPSPEPVYDPDAPELNSGDRIENITAGESSHFPVSHELLLKDHSKVLSALAVDPSGARLLSGAYDYECKLWDFGGMDSRCKPFKSWEPAGCYYVS